MLNRKARRAPQLNTLRCPLELNGAPLSGIFDRRRVFVFFKIGVTDQEKTTPAAQQRRVGFADSTDCKDRPV